MDVPTERVPQRMRGTHSAVRAASGYAAQAASEEKLHGWRLFRTMVIRMCPRSAYRSVCEERIAQSEQQAAMPRRLRVKKNSMDGGFSEQRESDRMCGKAGSQDGYFIFYLSGAIDIYLRRQPRRKGRLLHCVRNDRQVLRDDSELLFLL